MNKPNQRNLKRIQTIRKKIDEYDNQILVLFSKRFKLVQQIGVVKFIEKLPVVQKDRMVEILRAWEKLGMKRHLHAAFIRKFFKLIHHESIGQQREVIKRLKMKNKTHKKANK